MPNEQIRSGNTIQEGVMFYGVSCASIPRERSPQFSLILCVPFIYAYTFRRRTTKFIKGLSVCLSVCLSGVYLSDVCRVHLA